MSEKPKWRVNVIGRECHNSWEISVVREDFERGFRSHGWFESRKLLIGSSGGPCQTPVISFVWKGLIRLAMELCEMLNRDDITDEEIVALIGDKI